MESWVDIINDDTTIDHDADHIVLPAKNDVELKGPNVRREISYRFDDDNPDKIIRTERTYELVNTKKKISNASVLRKKQWVKFGQCKAVRKGELERGVTNQREGNFPFLWNGKNMMKKKKSEVKSKGPSRRRDRSELHKFMMESDQKEREAKQSTVYRPRQLRVGYEEEEHPEIKISNLPQWTQFEHVKLLIDQFHRNVLGAMYPPRSKIRMIPSKRTLEEWHSDPKTYANRLAEYERLAIVQFDDEQSAKKAIETLDGHQYSNHILRVEKAKPRRQ